MTPHQAASHGRWLCAGQLQGMDVCDEMNAKMATAETDTLTQQKLSIAGDPRRI